MKMKKVNPQLMKKILKMIDATQQELISSGWVSDHLFLEVREIGEKPNQKQIQMLKNSLLYDKEKQLSTLLEVQLEILARINCVNYVMNSFAIDDLFEECSIFKSYLNELELIYLDLIHDHFTPFATIDDVNLVHEYRELSYQESLKQLKENELSDK